MDSTIAKHVHQKVGWLQVRSDAGRFIQWAVASQ